MTKISMKKNPQTSQIHSEELQTSEIGSEDSIFWTKNQHDHCQVNWQQ
jgi:hypothetical protein